MMMKRKQGEIDAESLQSASAMRRRRKHVFTVQNHLRFHRCNHIIHSYSPLPPLALPRFGEMGTLTPSHRLSGGLYVSGSPEPPRERQPTIGTCAVPYTGGDVRKSGELGKMFDIQVLDHTSSDTPPSNLSPPSSSSQENSGNIRSGPNSGPIPKGSKSGPNSKKSSGQLQLSPTGLIVSGPLGSSPLSGGGRRSGPLEQAQLMEKAGYGSSVTSLSEKANIRVRFLKAAVWVCLVVLAMGFVVGAFLMIALKKPVILAAVGAVLVPAVVIVSWNVIWRKRGFIEFVRRYPEAELRGAVNGQYVKVTGVVTCGSVPLQSSYHRAPRCVYVSTKLFKYRGWRRNSANTKQRCFSWESTHSEKYVGDFYISDFQSGLRVLVKAGHGAKVVPFVKPAAVVDVTKENKDLSPGFISWLDDRKLSGDDRAIRLKEGYIKEGSTVSVMGVVQRHDNVLMVAPPTEPISTGWQWGRCLLPSYVQGLVLLCDENQNAQVVPA